MRVPLRIYNHIGGESLSALSDLLSDQEVGGLTEECMLTVTGARPFYDLTNPVIYQRDEATISTLEKDAKIAPARRQPRKSGKEPPSRFVFRLKLKTDTSLDWNSDVGRPEFEQFATNLISSISSISPELPHHQQQNRPFPQLSASIGAGGSRNGGSKSIMDVGPEMRPEMSSHRGGGGGPEAFGIDLDEQNGCKAAVEIVSRNSQKGKCLFATSRATSKLTTMIPCL